MNRLLTLIMALFFTSLTMAQDEPVAVQLPNDTLKLGALKIIKINGDEKKNWLDVDLFPT